MDKTASKISDLPNTFQSCVIRQESTKREFEQAKKDLRSVKRRIVSDLNKISRGASDE